METIQSDPTGAPFVYGGSDGILVGSYAPELRITYETEPPHGDPLYRLTLSGKALSTEDESAQHFTGTPGVRLFWGRNLILSPCGRYFALSEYAKLPTLGSACRFGVFDLFSGTEFFNWGSVQFERLVFPELSISDSRTGEQITANLEQVPWRPWLRKRMPTRKKQPSSWE